MIVQETTYVGASQGSLHVYILKFGKDMYLVGTQRYKPSPRTNTEYSI